MPTGTAENQAQCAAHVARSGGLGVHGCAVAVGKSKSSSHLHLLREGRECQPRPLANKPAAKHQCSQCKLFKIEDAFPRAQLKTATTQQCLACLQSLQKVHCTICNREKPQKEFSPAVITLSQGRCCSTCQAEAKGKLRPGQGSRGWFACLGCEELLPKAAQPQQSSRRCQNCSSRSTRAVDVQTCRGCGQKFTEKVKDGCRKRMCFKCRLRSI